MATVELSPTNPDHPRHTVTIDASEKIALCRCWHSKKFPFCDGTHREPPGRGPCVIVVNAAPPAKEG
jgi:CDGSH-type Zn-finger protein